MKDGCRWRMVNGGGITDGGEIVDGGGWLMVGDSRLLTVDYEQWMMLGKAGCEGWLVIEDSCWQSKPGGGGGRW